jgi:hypothetical protein
LTTASRLVVRIFASNCLSKKLTMFAPYSFEFLVLSYRIDPHQLITHNSTLKTQNLWFR